MSEKQLSCEKDRRNLSPSSFLSQIQINSTSLKKYFYNYSVKIQLSLPLYLKALNKEQKQINQPVQNQQQFPNNFNIIKSAETKNYNLSFSKSNKFPIAKIIQITIDQNCFFSEPMKYSEKNHRKKQNMLQILTISNIINLLMGNSSNKEDSLKIKILTGQTQSQELFDFHSPQKQQSISDLLFPSIIGYKHGEIIYLPQDKAFNDIQPLYRIECKDSKNIMIRQMFQRSTQFDETYIWKVLGQRQEMQLQEGDSIKIGKTKITFKQLVTAHETDKNPVPTTTDKQQTQKMELSSLDFNRAKQNDDACRICFDSSSTPTNPLVSLCKCIGSVKYIHYECLKDWRSNHLKKDKSPNCLYYSYTQPNCCELCKEPLANQFKHNGQKYQLFQFEKVNPPYAVFENRCIEQQTGKIRVSMYALSVPQKIEVSVGRNHTSQVILRDISVSRNHCVIVYKYGRLYIQDKKSKFGTLIRTKRGVAFDSQYGLQLQVQSKIVEISRAEAFNGCCAEQSSSYFIEINKGIHEEML